MTDWHITFHCVSFLVVWGYAAYIWYRFDNVVGWITSSALMSASFSILMIPAAVEMNTIGVFLMGYVSYIVQTVCNDLGEQHRED